VCDARASVLVTKRFVNWINTTTAAGVTKATSSAVGCSGAGGAYTQVEEPCQTSIEEASD
jgi:hypothetical protein